MAADRLRPFLQYTKHFPPLFTASSIASLHCSKYRYRSSAGSSNTGMRMPRTCWRPGKGCCLVTLTQKVTPSCASRSWLQAALALLMSSEAVTLQSWTIGGQGGSLTGPPAPPHSSPPPCGVGAAVGRRGIGVWVFFPGSV